jgi:cytochrome c oxidase subunit II
MMKQIPAPILSLLAGMVVTLVSLWVGQNHGLLPEQASEQAPLVDNFFNVMVTIATALFLVVQGAIVLFVIRYRRRAGDDTDGVPIEGSVPLEILWTAIPSIIVVGIGAYSVEVYAEMGGFDATGSTLMAHHHSSTPGERSPVDRMVIGDAIAAPTISNSEPGIDLAEARVPTYGIGASTKAEANPADLVVNVTGLQYAWIFNYPDSGNISGELHVPVGKDVQLNLSTQDVIHSFWVPQFRLKQDVIPGQNTELRFVSTKTGDYPIVCTELCGAYHGSMRTRIIVHTPEEFDSWLEQNRIAQQVDAISRIAVNPADLSKEEFLAPYAEEIGVNVGVLAQLSRN